MCPTAAVVVLNSVALQAKSFVGVPAKDPFCAERMRLGTCVTNPGVRDATVTASLLATINRITGGRMDLGIGRGDSSPDGSASPASVPDSLYSFHADPLM